MDRFEEGWEYDAEARGGFEPGVEPEVDRDPEELYLSLLSEEERCRYWSESVWTHEVDEGSGADMLLFPDRGAEIELGREIRLSELWQHCQERPCTMEEFLELSALITEVGALPGSLCADCAMLGRPNVMANWALATTTLCRGHLRFRLAHAQIDGGGAHRPV
jgi:hypothetical protein